MDSFQWDENFVTGIDEVDTQHMELVRIINRIGDALSNAVAPGPESLADLIDELAAYTRFHFAAEESMMAAQGINRRHLQLQSREHESFVDEIVRISQTEMS
ncbi:MAG: hemerythrin domain-containing protein, partial [Azoarcus sp.]|nr:hemerythrin domain-containing protein [Azoarcus sp.]